MSFNEIKARPSVRIGWWSLYLLWFGMMGWFIFGGEGRAGGGLKGPEDILASAKLDAEESWMGIYLGGTRIGYVQTQVEPLPEGGYRISELSRMAGAMLGAQQSMRMEMSVVTDSALALKTFTGELMAAPYSTRFEGEHNNKVLSVRITAGGKTSDRYIPAPEPIYLSQAIKPLLGAGRLGVGDSLKLSSFDPTAVEMQELIIHGGELKQEMLFGEQVSARKLTTRLGDFESSLYVDEKGASLAEFGPLGIILRKESREEALQAADGSGTIDFLDLFAVKAKGELPGDPRRVTRARYRLANANLAQVALSSARQKVEGDVVTVDAIRIPADTLPPDPVWSKDASFIESRDPAIIAAAKEAAGGGVSRLDTLERINRWVYNTVQKKPSAGLPSALAVLQKLEGDCNEHSTLFTALARAVGIPCRIELGVVYQSGKFYYHAWPAAWVEGRWIEFEPTFGDARADAARIALAAGDMSTASKLASMIGELQIEILSVE